MFSTSSGWRPFNRIMRWRGFLRLSRYVQHGNGEFDAQNESCNCGWQLIWFRVLAVRSGRCVAAGARSRSCGRGWIIANRREHHSGLWRLRALRSPQPMGLLCTWRPVGRLSRAPLCSARLPSGVPPWPLWPLLLAELTPALLVRRHQRSLGPRGAARAIPGACHLLLESQTLDSVAGSCSAGFRFAWFSPAPVGGPYFRHTFCAASALA